MKITKPYIYCMGLTKIDSIELSRYLLAKCGGMSHLKLQKMIYYVEAWHLAYFEESIVDDEFEAWMHGPVSQKIWHKFKDFEFPLHNILTVKTDEVPTIISELESKVIPDQKELISDVLEEYGNKSAYYLECLTHSELPWIEARNGYPPDTKCSNKISKKTMQKFYRQALYGESKDKTASA
jgi:uncharacterized phage-associated protein